MTETQQTLLEEWPDIVFDCPFCGKPIRLKQDAKSVFHRSWTFHFAYNHMNAVYANRRLRKHIEVFLWYFAVHDDSTGQELRDLIADESHRPEGTDR